MSHKTLMIFALIGALPFAAQRADAEDSSSVHEGQWPIQNGFNRQPTRGDLGGGHEFSSDQANEVDRLYDQLLSGGAKSEDHPGLKRAR
ncbi:MAG TPA: hypothetical protein VMB83_04885 [Roseiarcus sp.]|nr:hypothetical protein [Roseiarcus sp.]